MKLKCDICNRKDGFRGLELWQCKDCKVCVHRECYLSIPDDTVNEVYGDKESVDFEDRLFHCKACLHVKNKREKEQREVQRPTKCQLCSVVHEDWKTMPHAMHELYDEPGTDPKRKSIGWVHSICALYICSNPRTSSCVYGVDKNGMYENCGDEEYELSDGDKSEEEPTGWELDHFCIADGRDKASVDFKKVIMEHRRGLTCSICKKKDDTGKSKRIPIQCSLGDERVDKEFENIFSPKETSIPCSKAFHVGCALWQNQKQNSTRRVFYFPGQQEVNQDNPSLNQPQIFCFCTKHAGLLSKGKEKQKRAQAKKIRPSAALTMPKRSAIERKDSNISAGSNGDNRDLAKAKKKRNTTISKEKPEEKRTERKAKSKASADAKKLKSKSSNATRDVRPKAQKRRSPSKVELDNSEGNAFCVETGKIEDMSDISYEDTQSHLRQRKDSNDSNADQLVDHDPNPWASLWTNPTKKYKFGKWDSIQRVDPSIGTPNGDKK